MLGKSEGLNERDAAQKIVDEARQFIQVRTNAHTQAPSALSSLQQGFQTPQIPQTEQIIALSTGKMVKMA
jgi:hypothetical protein